MYGKLKKGIYKIYKKIDDFTIVTTISYFFYIRILPLLKGEYRAQKRNTADKVRVVKKQVCDREFDKIRIAVVCDEMTYQNFKYECELAFLTPYNWLEVLETFQPDIFLCESAWSGIEKYKNCWRGKIYKNDKIKFENRKELFAIIAHCKEKNIKTVFWNKEDPTFFGNKKYNFADTACKFDFVYTTASECVERYLKLGCQNVGVLMFGFSPKLFNPLNAGKKEDTAVFAGSWYMDQQERCADMDQLFRMVLKQDIKLRIYDRNYSTDNPIHCFPESYQHYIKPAVAFQELGKILKKSRYAININTVKDSDTMFARRVFELMACNICIISNYSKGLYNMFPDSIWYIETPFKQEEIEKYCKDNLKSVFHNHTNHNRLAQLFNDLGIKYKPEKQEIIFLYSKNKQGAAGDWQTHFKGLKIQNKKGYFMEDDGLYEIRVTGNRTVLSQAPFVEGGTYFVLVDLQSTVPNEEFIKEAILHFSYLKPNIGVRQGIDKYFIKKDNINRNVVFTIQELKKILEHESEECEKYLI